MVNDAQAFGVFLVLLRGHPRKQKNYNPAVTTTSKEDRSLAPPSCHVPNCCRAANQTQFDDTVVLGPQHPQICDGVNFGSWRCIRTPWVFAQGSSRMETRLRCDGNLWIDQRMNCLFGVVILCKLLWRDDALSPLRLSVFRHSWTRQVCFERPHANVHTICALMCPQTTTYPCPKELKAFPATYPH